MQALKLTNGNVSEPTEEDVGGVCLSFAQFELLSGHKKAAFHWLFAHLLCTMSYF